MTVLGFDQSTTLLSVPPETPPFRAQGWAVVAVRMLGSGNLREPKETGRVQVHWRDLCGCGDGAEGVA
jgi:hypothetical protein